MGVTCSAYGGREAYTGFFLGGGEPANVRDHLGDPGVYGRIILKWIFRNWDVGYGLDRGRWRAFVNTVMNLGLHKMRGNS